MAEGAEARVRVCLNLELTIVSDTAKSAELAAWLTKNEQTVRGTVIEMLEGREWTPSQADLGFINDEDEAYISMTDDVRARVLKP